MGYKNGVSGLAMLLLAQGIAVAQSDAEIRIILKYKSPVSISLSSPKQASQLFQLPVQSLTPVAGDAWLLQLQPQDANSTYQLNTVIQQLRNNPVVAYAVPDRMGHFKPMPSATAPEDDILLSHKVQWDEFKAPGGIMLETDANLRDGAWAYTTGMSTPATVVAVLDTGIALNDSLAGSLVQDTNHKVFGWNFAANNKDLSDETESWHGTHVAGTIAAFGEVMLGVGEHLKILPVKIPDKSGMFYESQVINAIYWSVGGKVPGVPSNPYPAKVLNMSFGVDKGPGKEIEHCDEALLDAINFARNAGAVIIVAAGNDNRWERYNAPGACNGTVKVAATGPTGLRAAYSNYGPSVSFAAPGGDLRHGKKGGILSTVNPGGGYKRSGFDFYQGTSMASPHAAGVAGLIYAASAGSVSPERVEQILFATSHAFGKSHDSNNSCVGTKPCGHGILDAANAVKAAMASYDVIITAPLAHELMHATCTRGEYRFKLPGSTSEIVRWNLPQTSCPKQVSDQYPELKQSANGSIIAYYGSMQLVMDSSLFRECQIIGSHGVGCYN